MKNLHNNLFFLKICFFVCFLLSWDMMLAQTSANDDCTNAAVISNPRNICINSSNVGATPSNLQTGCFSGNGNDVWFSFRAVGLETNIVLLGYSASSTGFTLHDANVAFSSGDCDALDERSCRSINASGFAEIVVGGLIVGETYHIRVWGTGNATGTFQLCIKNYNPPSNIDADCPTAAILCDKSPFTVAKFSGAGKIATELNDAPCLNSGLGVNAEEKSVWFKWTCQTSGSLSFKITPFYLGDSLTTFGDDIDFAVYELPNISDCSGKIVLRCMGSGPYPEVGCSGVNYIRRCQGSTGLRDGETDFTEGGGCNCAESHSNFAAPLQMVAGKSYAVGINNFRSNVGDGFSIEFDGTGTFVGPQAKIDFNKSSKKLCLGEDIVYSDASSFTAGQIAKRQWHFGKDASIDTANGTGPYTVFYKSPGWKAVVLTVTSDRGCQVTTILDSVYVEGFKYDSLIRQPTCDLGNNGMIRLSVTNCGRAPILYNWENTGFIARDSLSNLSKGTYRVAVTDSSRVYIDTFSFHVGPLEVTLDTAAPALKNPACFGFKNGIITLKPVTGTAPYEYSWNGRPWTLDNFLSALGEGSVSVIVRDANNCKGAFTFDVVAPPQLEVSVDTINISCYGLTNGKAIAKPAGGVGNYRVNWSNGALGDTVVNLKKGNYLITVFDGNSCEVSSGVTIKEPSQIFLNTVRIKESKCYGDSTAELVVLGSGGTPPFRYSIDGVRFQSDTAFLKIPAKTYTVVVRDSTGCKMTLDVPIPQPPQLLVNAGDDVEIDLGFSATLQAVVVPTSKAVSYIWTPQDATLSCKTCASVTVTPFQTTTYRVSVKDSMSCMAYDDVLIRVLKRRPVYIPNAFSPNGDGVNDYFIAYGNIAAVQIKTMKIFDRWGNLVFSGENLPLGGDRVGWNGTFNNKDLTPDVYVYYFIIKFVDGEEVLYKGDVTLIR